MYRICNIATLVGPPFLLRNGFDSPQYRLVQIRTYPKFNIIRFTVVDNISLISSTVRPEGLDLFILGHLLYTMFQKLQVPLRR